MDKKYLKRRNKKNYTSYRMRQRTYAIIDNLRDCLAKGADSILDIGTADGRVLSEVAYTFNFRCAVGIDLDKDALILARERENHGLKISLGNAVELPFKDGIFDIVLASAVVEHISDTEALLREFRRVLKKGGVLCITVPNPFYDWINSKVVETHHVKRYSFSHMKNILQRFNFSVVKAAHFMLSPFGQVPFERYLVLFVRSVRLDFLLFNQIFIAIKQ